MIALIALALAAEPACTPLTDDLAVREKTLDLAGGLRCPVCQGMSVADSSTEVAVGMKNQIEKMVREGYCEDQIIDYFIERYTSWVLLEPPAEGTNQLIYLAPGVVVLLGLIVVVLQSRRRETPVAAPSTEPINGNADALEQEHTEQDSWRQRVLEELDPD